MIEKTIEQLLEHIDDDTFVVIQKNQFIGGFTCRIEKIMDNKKLAADGGGSDLKYALIAALRHWKKTPHYVAK